MLSARPLESAVAGCATANLAAKACQWVRPRVDRAIRPLRPWAGERQTLLAPAAVHGPADPGAQGSSHHRLLQDRSDDLQRATAVRAVRQVDPEDVLEQAGPTRPHRPMVCTARLAIGGRLCLRGHLGPSPHHHRRQRGVGCRQAKKKRISCRRGVAWRGLGTSATSRCMKLDRRHHPMGAAVAPGCLQLLHDSPSGVQAETVNIGDELLAPWDARIRSNGVERCRTWAAWHSAPRRGPRRHGS